MQHGLKRRRTESPPIPAIVNKSWGTLWIRTLGTDIEAWTPRSQDGQDQALRRVAAHC